MKTRVLLVNEFSGLNTGYSTYGRELLSRLSKESNLEVAELATYVAPEDLSTFTYQPQWKVFINQPPKNTPEYNEYRSNTINEFGAFAFETTLLKYRPHVVLALRDNWMDCFIDESPFRKHFKYVWMPTADGDPLNEEWIDAYSRADSLLTYTDWSKQLIEKQTGNKVRVSGSAPPATQAEFTILNKHKLKSVFGINSPIIGTVMRNQKRKLYPALFEAFRLYINETNDKTLLYCHTYYPDLLGWDIPKLLLEYGLSSRVLFTYTCRNCRNWFPGFFADSLVMCPHCNNMTGVLANVKLGLNNEQMCQVYNLFDLYIQYSTCLPGKYEILTKNGFTAIKDVKVGDYTISHTGRWDKITELFQHQIDDKIVKIKTRCTNQTLELTKDHRVYTVKHTQNIKSLIKLNKIEFEWKPASLLTKNDYMVFPIDDQIIEHNEIDFATVIDKEYSSYNKNCQIFDNYIQVKHGSRHVRYIPVDYNLCKFIGLFAADGNSSNGISITSNIKDTENVKLVQYIAKNYFKTKCTTDFYKKRNAVRTSFYGLPYTLVFKSWFNKKDKKQLPEWCMKLDPQLQRAILIGLCMGDGCYCRKRDTTIFCTTSNKIYEQVLQILRRLRIRFNSNTSIRDKTRKPLHRIEIRGNIKNGTINDFHKSSNYYYKNYHITKIESVTTVNYSGLVYNIETEHDHSYTTRSGIVHNCEGFGIPIVEAASCGVPVMAINYSAPEDILQKIQGIKLQPESLQLEIETGRKLAVPNISDLCDNIKRFMKLPEQIRNHIGYKTREQFKKHYLWDNTASVWLNEINKFDHSISEASWNSPQKPIYYDSNIPDGLTNRQYVEYLIENILQQPEKIGSYFESRLLRQLNYGAINAHLTPSMMDENSIFSRVTPTEFTREDCFKYVASIVNKYNYWELKR